MTLATMMMERTLFFRYAHLLRRYHRNRCLLRVLRVASKHLRQPPFQLHGIGGRGWSGGFWRLRQGETDRLDRNVSLCYWRISMGRFRMFWSLDPENEKVSPKAFRLSSCTIPKGRGLIALAVCVISGTWTKRSSAISIERWGGTRQHTLGNPPHWQTMWVA